MCYVFSNFISFNHYKIYCGRYKYSYFINEELKQLVNGLPINPQIQLFHLTPWKLDHCLSKLDCYNKMP